MLQLRSTTSYSIALTQPPVVVCYHLDRNTWLRTTTIANKPLGGLFKLLHFVIWLNTILIFIVHLLCDFFLSPSLRRSGIASPRLCHSASSLLGATMHHKVFALTVINSWWSTSTIAVNWSPLLSGARTVVVVWWTIEVSESPIPRTKQQTVIVSYNHYYRWDAGPVFATFTAFVVNRKLKWSAWLLQ